MITWLKRRRVFAEHHTMAMRSAQEAYYKYAHLDVVSKDYQEGPFHIYTAASPRREAWDVYFDVMLDHGEDPWKGERRFDRELKV